MMKRYRQAWKSSQLLQLSAVKSNSAGSQIPPLLSSKAFLSFKS